MRKEMRVQRLVEVKLEERSKSGVRREAVDPAAIRHRAGSGNRLDAHQSILAPEALTMRPQRSWSRRMTSANSFEVLVHGSKACRLRRWRISGARMASMSAWLSRVVIAGGRPAGATMPNQRSDPASL